MRETFRLGDTWRRLLITTASSGQSVWPVSAPIGTVARGSTVVGQIPFVAVDPGRDVGLFVGKLFLGAGFSVGHYAVHVAYVVNQPVSRTFEFEVLGGGDAVGSMNAVFFWDRSEADYIVAHSELGKVVRGRNPSPR